ncbi:MAG: hypothetical protein IJM44_06210, partial [Ruminococcus sp.]|nr:hypothetical protein [Ruminococcus sp.]
MAKGRTIQRISNKKRGRPRVRFNFWFMVILFAIGFAACFILYMVAANINDNFFSEEFASVSSEADSGKTAQTPSGSGTEAPAASAEKPKAANPIATSAAVDASYLDSCMLVTDKTLLGMKTGYGFKYAVGSENLNAFNCATERVETSSGVVTISEAVGLLKPANVYLMLGSDLGTNSSDEMISSYVSLISNIRTAFPDVNIYVLEYPPVITETETLTNEIVNDYNSKLLAMADRIG